MSFSCNFGRSGSVVKKRIEEAAVKELEPLFRSVEMVREPMEPLPVKPLRNFRARSEMKFNNDTVFAWTPGSLPSYPAEKGHLEKTSFEICSESPITIAQRILYSNKVRSVQAKYDNEEATVKCTTSSNVSFNINLYKGRSAASVLVEVRKWNGCDLSFRSEFRAIEKAVKFCDFKASEKSPHRAMAISEMECMKIDYIPLQDGVIEESLETAQNFILRGGHAKVLYLEDVASITDPQYSSKETAIKASKMIMKKYSGIQEAVESILFARKGESAFDTNNRMRSLSLIILKNLMIALSKEEVLSPSITYTWHTEKLITSLLEEIKNSEEHLMNASLAAKCLSLLVTNSEKAKRQAKIAKALTTLQVAKRIGKQSYARLEHESQCTINALLLT